MASEAINNLLNNPDQPLSDPSLLLLAGVVSVSAIALTCYCLTGKKNEIKEEKIEEKVVEKKEKGKVEDSKKRKKEDNKVKPEKKNISVNHPLWISSTSTGGTLNGFAYNVFSSFFVF